MKENIKSKREDGYYFVFGGGSWGVARFYEGKWYLPGEYCIYEESDFQEIDERIIERK